GLHQPPPVPVLRQPSDNDTPPPGSHAARNQLQLHAASLPSLQSFSDTRPRPLRSRPSDVRSRTTRRADPPSRQRPTRKQSPAEFSTLPALLTQSVTRVLHPSN